MAGLATTLPKQTWFSIIHKTFAFIGLPSVAALAVTIVFMSTFLAEMNFSAFLAGLVFPLGIAMTGLFGAPRARLAQAQLA